MDDISPSAQVNQVDRAYVLGSLKTEMGTLKTGLEQATDILRRLQEELKNHEQDATTAELNLQHEVDSLKTILTEQTKRVTALFEVTSENTKWLQANGALVDVVEDHEKRVTDLEHDKSFVKGVIWLCGGAIAIFGLSPLLKKLVEWFFSVS